MFDLEADPQELHDLATMPEHAALRDDLEKRATAGWSAALIQKTLAERAASAGLMRQWANQTKPRAEAQWSPPPGANVFPE